MIADALLNSHNLDEVILNLSKAFDLVPHQRLVHKFNGYGVTNELAEWFEDFLRNREQRVFPSNVASNWAEVLSGVLQGSLLFV